MTRMKQSILIVSVALMVAISLQSGVLAQELDYLGVEATIQEDLSVKNKVIIQFTSPVNHFNYELNFPVYNLQTASDFEFSDCLLNNKQDSATISCDLIGMSSSKNTLTLEFDTRNQIKRMDEDYQLTMDYSLNNDVQESFILIRLPENGVLSMKNETYFPGNGKTLTDGRRIMVYWQNEETDQNHLQFSVIYNTPNVGGPFYSLLMASLTFIVIIVMIVLAVYMKRGRRSVDIVKSVLNRDEKTLVDILTKHKGKAGQKVLVRESDFSKAKVSRLVNSLKKRRVVDTEPISGRENRVMLVIEQPAREEREENAKESQPVQ